MKFRHTPIQLQKIEKIKALSQDKSSVKNLLGINITNTDFKELEEQVTGRIVYPSSPTYNDDRRDFNLTYQANPLVIVFVANYGDIRACLAWANKLGVLVTLRSGRHSIACYSISDGMIIDISGLKSITVNYNEQTAEIQAGNTFGDINPALEFYGLHMPGGECPTVSIAGYMQGGGYGMTSRTYGMNVDCVLEITMMLADGSVVVANSMQNEDLFWAVRGGTGGNFGVLLSVKYKVFKLDLIWGIRIIWDFETDNTAAATALFTIQEIYLAGFQHPELGIQTALYTDNTGDGRKKLLFAGTYIGTESKLNQVIKPLLAIDGAKLELKQLAKYSKINAEVLANVPNIPLDVIETLGGVSRSAYLEKSLSIGDYKSILDFFKTSPNKFTLIGMEGYGGVINQQPVGSNAFIHRKAIMDLFCDVFFVPNTPDQTKNEAWIKDFIEFLKKYSNGHSYQNYPNRDQQDFQWAYWGPYYNQLLSIKLKYNPNNVFLYQQSINKPLKITKNAPQITVFKSKKSIKTEKY